MNIKSQIIESVVGVPPSTYKSDNTNIILILS